MTDLRVRNIDIPFNSPCTYHTTPTAPACLRPAPIPALYKGIKIATVC
jgi:hypothetical protein